MGNERLRSFHQNVERLSLSKEHFPFSRAVPFGYDKSANEGTVKFFWQNLGQFPRLPDNRGTRLRIQSRDIKNRPPPYTMPPTVSSIPTSRSFAGSEIQGLIRKKKNKEINNRGEKFFGAERIERVYFDLRSRNISR